MQEIKNKVEAVLFITGRLMTVEEIAQFCSIGSVGSVKNALKALVKEYKDKQSGLEIIEEDKKYKLNIRKEYNHLSTNLISSCDLDAPTQATLALIAYKQPALQSEIVKMRGNTAYDHVKTLREMEFITSEKKGRTRLLKLGPKFYDYFDVVEETLKERFHPVGAEQEKMLEEEKEPVEEEKEDVQQEIVIDVPKEEKEEVIEEEIEHSSPEVLVTLDADDFGSST